MIVGVVQPIVTGIRGAVGYIRITSNLDCTVLVQILTCMVLTSTYDNLN